MSSGYFFGLFIFVSIVSIRLGMLVMDHYGILDHPGGHKQHAVSTPFVGGFGVFAALIGGVYFAQQYFPPMQPDTLSWLALGALVLFVTGLADDVWDLSFRVRLLVQSLVALAMALVGGVELHTLGRLVFGKELLLGWLGLPFTIFATVGLINALNMLDGIDGITGALSFICLGFVALLSGLAGNEAYLLLSVAVMGGIAGFLVFNLRYPSNHRARVFLGDNGSMLLGFVFAWFFIALSQGEQKAMTPVTALWLFCLPLMDTVGVTLRRMLMGKSPFHADRSHLHHLFIRAGFRVSDTVWIVSLAQAGLGAIGIAGLLLGVPEGLMFALFLALFGAYFSMIARPWRFVLSLRRLNLTLRLPSVFARGIFIGHFEKSAAREILEMLKSELADVDSFRLSLHRLNCKTLGSANIYAIVDIECHDDEQSIGHIQRLMTRIKARLAQRPEIRAHLLMQRCGENDRRRQQPTAALFADAICQRATDRREIHCHPEMYSAIARKEKSPRTITQLVESIHSAF